jgi:pimeloyl-ACP methyl ester carboxylesterase
MFEPFPGNYVWNLAVNLALYVGGNHGEIDAACRPLREAAARGEDAGTELFFDSWLAVADRVSSNAARDLEKGRKLSAAAKLRRAAIYYQTAERMQSREYEPRKQAYRQALLSFQRSFELASLPIERVEIAYEGSSYPALFWKANNPGTGGRVPAVVCCNGLDSTKELVLWTGIAESLIARGISVLCVDQPGTGEALRLKGLTGVHDSERWASRAVDWLENRPEIDVSRIGMFGLSLGGYFAPRAAAYEKRFALCAVLGANHNWGEMQRRRRQREGETPVPHYWDHVMWVFGKPDIDSFMKWAPAMCLDDVVEKIRVPFLVTHGVGDRQIPVEYARRSYDQAVNSPKRELRIFTPDDFAIEHCEADNGTVACDYIADWIAETFGMPVA